MSDVPGTLQKRRVFCSAQMAACQLGVPHSWLMREVKAGRLPGMRAGGRWLVPVDEVKAELLRIAGCDLEGGDA